MLVWLQSRMVSEKGMQIKVAYSYPGGQEAEKEAGGEGKVYTLPSTGPGAHFLR